MHVLQATRAGSFTARIGSLRPLFRSATGKMLLVSLPEREIARLLKTSNAQEPDAKLHLNLEEVIAERRSNMINGYAMSRGTSMAGAAALAVKLPVPRGHAPLTLSLGGPIEEIDSEKDNLLEILLTAVKPFEKAAGL